MNSKYNGLVATAGNAVYGTPDPTRNISLTAARAFLAALAPLNLGLGAVIYAADEQPFFGQAPKPMGATQLLLVDGPEGIVYPSNTDSEGPPFPSDALDLVVNVVEEPPAGSLVASLGTPPPPPGVPILGLYNGLFNGTPVLVVNIQRLKTALGM